MSNSDQFTHWALAGLVIIAALVGVVVLAVHLL